MTDLAFFRPPTGPAWLGIGPFVALAECPNESAFYINSFDLDDPCPWKVPSRLIRIGSSADLAAAVGASEPCTVRWVKPSTEGFKMVFRRIRRDVLAGRLHKMVPVLTERGDLLTGHPLHQLDRLLNAPSNVWAYANSVGGAGFMGATPELLFHRQEREVLTMALAGTAKPGADADFLIDVKEIEEHEIVARFLMDQLGTLGPVERSPRQLCTTAGLRHFQSHIRVHGDALTSPDELIRILHPTPAVGCLPRSEEWLQRQRDYRSLLRVPGFFGAPFGFSHAGQQHLVVAIRGMAWAGDELSLPSGCGIVAGSAFDHEWRELRLKREAAAALLGL
jgi:menaquinone-specific isochorismate synthase